jgi:hypothetical protein
MNEATLLNFPAGIYYARLQKSGERQTIAIVKS